MKMVYLTTLLLVCFDYILSCFGVVLFICGYRGTLFSEEIRNLSEFMFLSRIILFLGILIMSIAAVQMIAIITKCPGMLLSLIIYLIFVFVIQLIMLGMFYQSTEPYYGFVQSSVTHWTTDYHKDNASRVIMDEIQKSLNCCGIRGPGDWTINRRPISCCPHLPNTETPCLSWLASSNGCSDMILQATRKLIRKYYWHIVGGIILQMFFMISTCYEWAAMQTECMEYVI